MKSIYTIALFLLLVLPTILMGQSTFSVTLLLKNSDLTDTLKLGVGLNNTFGVDDAESFGVFRDKLAPPLPPAPIFDARFVTLPGHVSTYPSGLGTGTYTDYRAFTSSTQTDTFLLKLTGDFVDNNSTVISWQSQLGKLATSWVMQPRTGSSFAPVDMVNNTSATIPAGTAQIYVIKIGAIGTAVPSENIRKSMEFNLMQNYPNPFNPSTKINFTLPVGGNTTLKVFNVMGQEIERLVDEYMTAGSHTSVFDASAYTSGVYFYQLKSNDYSSVKRMILVK